MIFRRIHLVLMVVGLTASPALASSISFSTSGTTSGGAVSAAATFTLSGTNLDIALENTTVVYGSVASVLDAFSFTLPGGSGLTLTSVEASGFVDCTGVSCVTSATFHDYHGSSDEVSPYLWSLAGSYELAAGNGSYKPGGIVGATVTPIASVGNTQHNDYLLGPVTFHLSYTTAPTTLDVSNVLFFWGTTPESTSGTPCLDCDVTEQTVTPEPASLLLLGTGLIGLAAGVRRRSRRSMP